MKAVLTLAIILCSFTTSAGTIRESNKFHPGQLEIKSNLSEGVQLITTQDASPARQSEFHCNVINAEGQSPCGAVAFSIPPPSPTVTGTPEPSPSLLFGTVILGALALTKIRN
jgi:hypothetical protein